MTPPGRTTGAALLGYEPALLATLPAWQRAQLDALAYAWGVSAVLLSIPMGYAVWLVEGSFALSLAVAAGTFALVGNLLRLLVAGSGAASDHPWPVRYRPPRAPGIMIGALSLMLAQPALLMVDGPRTDGAVRTHRVALLAAHREALSDMGVSQAAAGQDAFARQTARCQFVVLRLKTLWTHPQRTALGSAVFVLFVLVPFLLGRTLWLRAVLGYERARHGRSTATRVRLRAAGRRAADDALRAWPSYRAEAGA